MHTRACLSSLCLHHYQTLLLRACTSHVRHHICVSTYVSSYPHPLLTRHNLLVMSPHTSPLTPILCSLDTYTHTRGAQTMLQQWAAIELLEAKPQNAVLEEMLKDDPALWNAILAKVPKAIETLNPKPEWSLMASWPRSLRPCWPSCLSFPATPRALCLCLCLSFKDKEITGASRASSSSPIPIPCSSRVCVCVYVSTRSRASRRRATRRTSSLPSRRV